MRLPLDPFQLLLISLAGGLDQRQQEVIDYLQEQNRVLREQPSGQRLRFSDDQRRRLAVRAKKLGRRVLRELATLVAPETLLAWHRKLIAPTPAPPVRTLAVHSTSERHWRFTKSSRPFQTTRAKCGDLKPTNLL